MKKTFVSLFLLYVLVFFIHEAASNNTKFTEARKPLGLSQVIEQLVVEELLAQKEKQKNITVSETELTEEINKQVARQNLTLEDFKALLYAYGTNFDDYKQIIRKRLIEHDDANTVSFVQKTEPNSISALPLSISDAYQEEDVLISFNRAYRQTDESGDKFFIELKLKILADNKIIKLNTGKYVNPWQIQVLDNFGNDLGFCAIEPYPSPSDSLRPGEEKLFTIKFSIKPLESTEYILLKIPMTILGNINPFELKIVNPVFEIQKPTLILDKRTYTTEELDRMESEARFERWQKENAEKRKANKRLLIEASVVSLLVVIITITWLLVKEKSIRQFIVSYRIQIISWIGILFIVLMCLFPPHRGWQIDFIRLCLRCGIVALITGGLIYTFCGKKRD